MGNRKIATAQRAWRWTCQPSSLFRSPDGICCGQLHTCAPGVFPPAVTVSMIMLFSGYERKWGVNNVALWGTTNVVKRIARHQGQRRFGVGPQHADVSWVHEPLAHEGFASTRLLQINPICYFISFRARKKLSPAITLVFSRFLVRSLMALQNWLLSRVIHSRI